MFNRAEAVKHKRDSWQTWENYAQVAARISQWQAAARALGQVLLLSNGQRLDLAVLAALVGQVEVGRSGGSAAAGEGDEQTQQQQLSAAASGGDAAMAAEGAAPAADPAAGGGGEAASGMAELATALGEMSTSGGSSGAQAAAADAAAASAEALEKADARAAEVLEQSVGSLMKQVAASISGDSAFWEVYAR